MSNSYAEDSEYSDLDDSEEYDEDPNDEFVRLALADLAWAKTHYSGRNEEFARMEDWYHKKHYLSNADYPAADTDIIMDEATDETSSEHLAIVNILTNTINQVHGVLFDEDPVIEAMSSSSRKSATRAQDVERFLYGVRWNNRQAFGEDAWAAAGLNALVKGWGCVKTCWDIDRAEYARRNKDALDPYAFPVLEQSIDPADVYPLPNGVRERWRGMIWCVKRTVREVEEEWACKLDGEMMHDPDTGLPMYDAHTGDPCYEEMAPDSLIDYVDYWVWKRDDGKGGTDWTLWNCVLAGEQSVKLPTPMYEYKMLPYEVFFCRASTSRAAHLLGLSFMFPLIEPVQEMEYIISRMLRMADQYADPILLVKDATGNPADIEKEPGTVITVGEGGDAHYVTWQGSPPDFNRILQLERDLAQDAFPPVMAGIMGGSSGLDPAALQQGGKMQTNRPRRNIEQAMQRCNTKAISLLQAFSMNEDIVVFGECTEGDEQVTYTLKIKGKDTKGYENTAVHIRGRFPGEELRNVALAAQAAGTGLMSSRNASKRFMYVQNPEKEYRMWLQEQTIKDPQWRQMFLEMYRSLPARSAVGAALAPPEDGSAPPTASPDMMAQIQGMMSAPNLAGGDIAAALATNDTEAQMGVQRTAGPSNIFSSMMGGTAYGPPS